MKKRYRVVFTCMASRAIHKEVAASLDTSSCIDAIRRFTSRRGPAKEIHSDNGTYLVGACKELKQALKDLSLEDLMRFNANQGIRWHFNPPAGSHHCGVWERQIRTIRKILQALLNGQYLKTCQNEEQLQTLVCEVETIVNSRPLTKASDDPNDLGVITPNDLLHMKTTSPPPGKFIPQDVYARRRWRQIQYLADIFWKWWVREYLPTLQERQKWLKPQRSLQIGDIVLIADETAPRSSWSMAKAEDIVPDKQGLVCSARVQTKTGALTRPETKLCLLLSE